MKIIFFFHIFTFEMVDCCCWRWANQNQSPFRSNYLKLKLSGKITSVNSESQPLSVFVLVKKKRKKKVSHCKSLNFTIKGYDSASTFIHSNLIWHFLKCAFHVGDEHGSLILLFKLNGTKYTTTESKTWDRKREGVGSDFSSLKTTFKSQPGLFWNSH